MSQSIHLLSDLTTFGAVSAISLTAVGMLSAGRLNIVSDAVIGTSLAVAGPISGSSFSGVGSSLTALNASNLSSGTVPQARLGISGSRDTSTFLRGDGSWTSAVTAVSVVSANGVSASVANQGTTPAITLTLGAITPSSVTASGNVSGTTLSSSGQATVLSLVTTGASTAQTLTSTGKASVGGTLTVTGATSLSTLDATGAVTAPNFKGAMLATGAFTPVLTTGVYAGVNSANTAIPQFGLVATAAPTNAKASSFYIDPTNGTLNWTLLLDDLGTNASFMTVARSGITATNITFSGTAITLNGAVTGSSFTTTGSSTAQTLTSTGKASIGGTLGVTGATTLTTLNTSGQASLNALSVATTANVTGDLTVSGTANVNSMSAVSAAVTGSATIAGALSVGGSISGSGSGLTALNASSLSSGTVAVAVLGSAGTRDTSTFLRGDNSWATALTGVSVVSANGISATIANGTTTPAITLSLGAITPSSINSTGSVTAPVFIPTQTTVPTTGVYAAATGGVAIATNSLERFEVTQTGQINIGGPIVQAINPVSASAIDCSKGNYFTKTYTRALTWTFTNVPTGGFYRFVLRLIRGAAGTQTWPSTVKWTGGTTPSLTTTNGGSDIFEFMTDDGGASWRAYRLTTTTT